MRGIRFLCFCIISEVFYFSSWNMGPALYIYTFVQYIWPMLYLTDNGIWCQVFTFVLSCTVNGKVVLWIRSCKSITVRLCVIIVIQSILQENTVHVRNVVKIVLHWAIVNVLLKSIIAERWPRIHTTTSIIFHIMLKYALENVGS